MKSMSRILGLLACVLLLAACSDDHYTKGVNPPGAQNSTAGGAAIADGSQVIATRALTLYYDQYIFALNKFGGPDAAGDFCGIQIPSLGPSMALKIQKDAKLKIKFEEGSGTDFQLELDGQAQTKIYMTCYKRDKVSGDVLYIPLAELTSGQFEKIMGLKAGVAAGGGGQP